MRDSTALLREADPISNEGSWTAAERQALRRAMLDAQVPVEAPSRRVFTYGVAAAAATAAAVIAGLEWPRDAVLAAIRFEVRLAEAGPGLELDAAIVHDSGERIYLHRQAVLTNGDIASAEPVQDASGSFSVVVSLTRDGAAKLAQTTRQNLGRRLAILVDGQVVLAPTVRSPIRASAVISGSYTKAEADRIAAGIIGR
jgi:hypothetical protein